MENVRKNFDPKMKENLKMERITRSTIVVGTVVIGISAILFSNALAQR
jgi:hypothetical protein